MTKKVCVRTGDFIEAGDLIFDVGANAGNKAELFLRDGARVVCIEPQPACVDALLGKFGSNPKVTIINKGLADKPGVLNFSICTEATTISTFNDQWKTGRFANYKWDKVIPVEVTTLDDMIKAHGRPRYCKIDVEGFEVSVVKGLTQPVPFLSFEFTREFIDNARTCVSHLQGIGYKKFSFTLGENPNMASENWLDADGLFQRIRSIKDSDLWGDIYACGDDSITIG